MIDELQDYNNRVSMATTQFIAMLDTLRNLRREGQALDYLDPDAIPTAAEAQAEAALRERLIATFSVFEAQGIFADITGEQKERAKKLYKMKRTSFVVQS